MGPSRRIGRVDSTEAIGWYCLLHCSQMEERAAEPLLACARGERGQTMLLLTDTHVACVLARLPVRVAWQLALRDLLVADMDPQQGCTCRLKALAQGSDAEVLEFTFTASDSAAMRCMQHAIETQTMQLRANG